MKVSHYELAVQLLSRDESDGGFIAEAHVIVKLTKADLELTLDQFADRYLKPALKQVKAEHDCMEEAVGLTPEDCFIQGAS